MLHATLLIVVVVGLAFLPAATAYFGEFPLEIELLSQDPELIWASIDMWDNCHELDVADIPMNAFQLHDGRIAMVSGMKNFHYMEGNSLFNVTRRDCQPSWNSSQNLDPALYTDAEWPTSTYILPNGTVIAMVHNEYHGVSHPHHCPPNVTFPYCMQFATGLLVSHDSGHHWEYARPPPHHIVATVPYPYQASNLASGWGDPTNIVESDGYYYMALWNRNDIGLQKAGICVMRSNNLIDPSSWRGWDGRQYSVSFASPYNNNNPHFDPSNHICTVLPHHPDLNPNKCGSNGLVVYRSPTATLFLMTWACHDNGFEDDVFYMTASEDPLLQNWSHPHPFFDRTQTLSNDTLKHVLKVNYPNLLDPKSPAMGDANYGKVDKEPYLFFVGNGHSPYSDGRRVFALPMRLTEKRKKNSVGSGEGQSVVE